MGAYFISRIILTCIVLDMCETIWKLDSTFISIFDCKYGLQIPLYSELASISVLPPGLHKTVASSTLI